MLVSIHLSLAAVTKTPELALDPQESKQLAVASAAVASMYAVEIDPKMVAWANLIGAVGMVYIPRAYLIADRRKKERGPRPEPASTRTGPTPYDPTLQVPLG